MNFCPETHILILLLIIIIVGSFGGYLNYLHNFDTSDSDEKNKVIRNKYILLGIGAALLVPVFLKMISSDLIKKTDPYDNICYLIFAGFCLIAAIFSKRFITTIGERILEKAKNAELKAQNAEKGVKETKEQIKTTKLELTTTQERIEDVKASVSLNKDRITNKVPDSQQMKILINLVDTYLEKTYIQDYSERLKKKAELGRIMGQLIVQNNFPKLELLKNHPKEGMYLALAYSIELKPEPTDLPILNKLSTLTTQLYIKYVILLAYRTSASSGIIKSEHVKEIYSLIIKFRDKADPALLRHIEDTINVLKFINAEI